MKKIEINCPKCGASPKNIKVLYDAGAYYVKCSRCGTDTDTYNRWTDAVDAWNKSVV